ncbi:hypothetical protein Nepgr_015019 [Nepenthes gracilis]|uniref:Uncharacterized protein n=1 Tax=Nepenthes gracilis TaxID=150966 RepID=A0AAD3SL37_NEPGR|nr:hypothetical protein Nepgr_015019 [Nepenthes gracilis]
MMIVQMAHSVGMIPPLCLSHYPYCLLWFRKIWLGSGIFITCGIGNYGRPGPFNCRVFNVRVIVDDWRSIRQWESVIYYPLLGGFSLLYHRLLGHSIWEDCCQVPVYVAEITPKN